MSETVLYCYIRNRDKANWKKPAFYVKLVLATCFFSSQRKPFCFPSSYALLLLLSSQMCLDFSVHRYPKRECIVSRSTSIKEYALARTLFCKSESCVTNETVLTFLGAFEPESTLLFGHFGTKWTFFHK